MPPLIFLLAAGAGLYAGYKMLEKLTHDAAKGSTRTSEAERRTDAKRQEVAKDLGELEWDEKSNTYIPKKNA